MTTHPLTGVKPFGDEDSNTAWSDFLSLSKPISIDLLAESNGFAGSGSSFNPPALGGDLGVGDLTAPVAIDLFSGNSAKGKPGGGGNGGGGGSTYVSGSTDGSGFNIQINFSGSWTAAQQAVVKWAANTWSSIITGDVVNVIDLNGNPVDDIVISMSTGRIDGNGNPLFGNVLAQTFITSYRDAGDTIDGHTDLYLPVTASIKLDSTDLKNSTFADTWDDIILHEMGHALGFAGFIFQDLNLVDGSNNFIGGTAEAAYGGDLGPVPVPLENGGGSGTAGSHWSENTFAPNGVPMSNELMTGYIVPGEQTYLSDTTVGALQDLGYAVNDPSTGSSYLPVSGPSLV
jgi:hypothetical protein